MINPTQWGSTAKLSGDPAVPTRQIKSRLIDVRLPTSAEGWQSRDCTVYTHAKILTGTAATNRIICTLQTGMGGLTSKESFRLPGVGRAIHIVADSIRLDVEIDSEDLASSFEVSANMGIGGLYEQETQIQALLYAGFSLSGYYDIPNYCTQFRIDSTNPQALTITPAISGAILATDKTYNGLGAMQYQPLSLPANQLWLSSLVDQTVTVTLKRPT